MMSELHRHCQCDNCSGRDCGQDDPERYLEQQFHDEETHDKRIRNETLDEVYKRLESMSHLIWQSPQSLGQKNVVNWSDINRLFVKLRGENK